MEAIDGLLRPWLVPGLLEVPSGCWSRRGASGRVEQGLATAKVGAACLEKLVCWLLAGWTVDVERCWNGLTFVERKITHSKVHVNCSLSKG